MSTCDYIPVGLNFESGKVVAKLDSFIADIDEALKLRYKEGKDAKENLDIHIRQFIQAAFSDGKEKIKECKGNPFFVLGSLGTPMARQEEYEEQLQRSRTFLNAWKDEAEMASEIEVDSPKIKKLKGEVEEKKLEAKRRKEVVETKFHGGMIEFIELQRKMMKEWQDKTKEDVDLQKDMVKLQKDMADIKLLLSKLCDKLDEKYCPELSAVKNPKEVR